tara:strand:+ start:83 stop:502 length:420 start_codon:yes stop_codon:yes gene_type:complete
MDSTTEPAMDVSPLIDVGFLLLIYFLVTTTLMKQEADLSMILPGVSSAQSEDVEIDQMMVKIEGDSSIFINDELVDSDPSDRKVPVLADRLERYAASAQIAGSEAMVVISCADETPEQRFVDVLNACAASGIKNVSLAQ